MKRNKMRFASFRLEAKIKKERKRDTLSVPYIAGVDRLTNAQILIYRYFIRFLNSCTFPEDSENCVINNYTAGLLFSVMKVFVIDS
jgi:hypothetical protein